MIIGLGLDLAEIPRIAAMADKWGERFVRKVFTERERQFCYARKHHARHLAARFAAKEATLKALGVPEGCSWKEMEVLGGGKEAPRMVLTGRAKAAADALGVARVHLTLTHTDETAAAVVVAERLD